MRWEGKPCSDCIPVDLFMGRINRMNYDRLNRPVTFNIRKCSSITSAGFPKFLNGKRLVLTLLVGRGLTVPIIF